MRNVVLKMILASRTLVIALAVTALATITSDAKADIDPFDGMWVIDMKPDAVSERKAAVRFEERITFINGKAVPHLFSQLGFEPVSSKFDFPTMTFTVNLKSRIKGQLVWSGKIKSTSSFAGDLVWTRPDGVVWRFSYDAKKMPEPVEPIIAPE